METKILPAEAESAMLEAARIIKRGGLVAFPSETVYGLGADGLNAEACKKIYEAKGRPSDNPLILHICDRKMLERIVTELPEGTERVMEAFWPGPLTLILPKADCVPDSVTGGLSTVAVRFPSHKAALRLIAAAETPIAGPSANSSGKPSPTRASHVEYDLSGKIDMILDGGACEVGLESTILDMTVKPPAILRPGAISEEMLLEVLGCVSSESRPVDDGAAPKAPGMKYTHYSPKARVIIVEGGREAVAGRINLLVKKAEQDGIRAGVLTCDANSELYAGGVVLSLGADIAEIGAGLFKALRKFDYLGVQLVYAEAFPREGEGAAVMNRMMKAAGGELIRA